MAISTGHKTLVFLGFMLLALGLVGCGVPEPTRLSPTVTPTAVDAQSPNTKASVASTADPDGAILQRAVSFQKMEIERAFSNLSFDRMVDLTFPYDSTNRLFVVLQSGQIKVFENEQGVESTKTFLDISSRVNDSGNEEGLLGIAFDPDYQHNGYFYVNYTASDPRRTVISRFIRNADDSDRANPDSELVILEIPQPFKNHNGGQVVFGTDGYLYISLGDGGSSGDPTGHGQNPRTLLGAILRIDVRSSGAGNTYYIPSDNPFVGNENGAREEIWAYGFRNPWRFSFDPETGDIWAADVGQNSWEEIDFVKPGLNYGWNVMEGTHCYSGRRVKSEQSPSCARTDLEKPVAEYGRVDGCSVTGGFVYRGTRHPSLYGAYIYGDFCSGKIWALRYDGNSVTDQMEIVDSNLRISAFGQDQSGELYILSFDDKIYRFSS